MVRNEDGTSHGRMIRGVKSAQRHICHKAENIRIRTYYRRKALRWKFEDAIDRVSTILHAAFDRHRSSRSRDQVSHTAQQLPQSPEILHLRDSGRDPFPWWNYIIPGGFQDVSSLDAVRDDGSVNTLSTTIHPDVRLSPWIDMTTWFIGGDARIQAYPHVYDDVSRTILQHAEGQLCSTTIQLDEGSGSRPVALCMGNDVRVADFVNSTVTDMARSQPYVTQANLRSMPEIMADRFTPMNAEVRAEFGAQRHSTLTMWRMLDGAPLL
ncbi:Hypothetical protein D9617_7g031840 [Elsinoe fawcettii]|nr:Hypothetical protein D9617_7g031840 [Elsinoe fawcettii]